MGRKKRWVAYGILVGLMLAFVLPALPMFLGMKGYAVLSGSMEPSIRRGAAVYVRQKKLADIRPGEVITYQTENRKMTVTHRVVEVHPKEKTFVTKGDANQEADKRAVDFSRVLGVVSCTLPYGGYMMRFLSKPGGRMGILGLLILLIHLTDYMEMKSLKNDLATGKELKTI